MFECLTKRFTPKGWPAEIEIRELVADDVIPMFVNGRPEATQVQRLLVYLATWTLDGDRVFESPEAVGKVPARLIQGLMEITNEVMRLNMPQTGLAAEEIATERPT